MSELIAGRHLQPVLAALLLCLLSMLSNAELSVLDDRGNRVTLPQPADRIVALAPHIVELMYAVGSGQKLVGAVSYSDYPPSAAELPQVGTHAAFSLEAILRLQPDLVLAWYSGNSPQRVEPIRALGIPVFYTEPRRLDAIGSVLERIGRLTAAPDAAAVADDFRRQLHVLRETYSRRAPVSVFYQVWNEPLQTLNREHIISDVITLCGGYNVFADARAIAPRISVESVLRADPQVIVASGREGERPDWDNWHRWPQLQAVAQQQLKFIPADIIQRHTPRILQGATLMCEHLQQARQRYGLVSP